MLQNRKSNIFILIIALVTLLVAACAANQPEQTETIPIESCPVTVKLTINLDQDGQTLEVINLGTTKFNSVASSEYWVFDEAEQQKFDDYLKNIVTSEAEYATNVVSMFGLLVENPDPNYSLGSWYPTIEEGECPEGGIQRELHLSFYVDSTHPTDQVNVVGDRVYFRTETAAGSTFNFWLPKNEVISLLRGNYHLSPVEPMVIDYEPSTFSAEIVRRESNFNHTEIGSYAIIPEDIAGRDQIFAIMHNVMRIYGRSDTYILTTFNHDGGDSSQLLGTILVP